jgi:hypothetical protein
MYMDSEMAVSQEIKSPPTVVRSWHLNIKKVGTGGQKTVENRTFSCDGLQS